MTASVGERIRDARGRAGLTREELACLVGVSPALVELWETDAHPPRRSRARLREVLNLDERLRPIDGGQDALAARVNLLVTRATAAAIELARRGRVGAAAVSGGVQA